MPSSTTFQRAGLDLKAASEPDLGHRDLLDGQFWRRLPGYRLVDEPQFLDGGWQARSSVTRLDKLREVLGSVLSDGFCRDVEAALRRAPMSLRLSPYVVALIDWKEPVSDPLRRQFVPLAGELRPDHPRLCFDSLCERADAPVPGLVHRYPDRALLVALDTCPVYCRFCTRSYAVGMDTETVDKHRLGVNRARWEQAFAYLADRPELEDVIVSGGDAYQLRADELRHIGDQLLAIPHVRRIRLATRGLAVMPMRILSDAEWLSTVADLVHRGRELHKQVMIHTHFNHAREVTAITKRALDRLLELGMTVRNQTVLLRGVNDDAQAMKTLVKRLGYVNVQPYYVYQHDMVAGVEDLRTPLSTAIALEKDVRGATSGYNTPAFVVDLPGGGGKRHIHSFEHYDRETGVSVWRSPNVDPNREYLYFDPIDQLPARGQLRWASPAQHAAMVEDALAAARASSQATGCS